MPDPVETSITDAETEGSTAVEGADVVGSDGVIDDSESSIGGSAAASGSESTTGGAPPVPGSGADTSESQQAAPPAAAGSARASAPSGADWREALGALEPDAVKIGAGIPLDRARELYEENLRLRREAEQGRMFREQFAGMLNPQARAPDPASEMPPWARTGAGDDLDAILGDDSSRPAGWQPPAEFVQDWQQQTQVVQELRGQLDELRQYIGRIQLRETVDRLSQRYPDVPAEVYNMAVAAGADPELAGMRVQAKFNELRAQFEGRTSAPNSPGEGAGAVGGSGSPAAPPRPASVGGKAAEPDAEKPWDNLPRHDRDAWITVRALMKTMGMSMEEIKRDNPSLIARLFAKRAG